MPGDEMKCSRHKRLIITITPSVPLRCTSTPSFIKKGTVTPGCGKSSPLERGGAKRRGVDSAPLGPAKLKISWVSLGEGDHGAFLASGGGGSIITTTPYVPVFSQLPHQLRWSPPYFARYRYAALLTNRLRLFYS